MKKFFSIIALFCACLTALSAADSTSVIYRIRLDKDIDKASQRLVVKGLENAHKAHADYVLLDLDTYGGAVDAADSISSAILRYDIPVVAFVNMRAVSAGALISIACDSIYMKTGSSMGAATVVDPTGAVMPDKYQSFMRGMMRATAEATGRDPHIAESMVDTANVLSLTASEAIKVGYCNAVAENVEEVITQVIGENENIIKEMEDDLTWLDKLINLLLNPLLQSIFMMMIIGGIFVEIRTPGIGLPLVTAIVGALLYFAPLYVEQLAASWEILLFVVGLILVALEVFVFPGFGVAGISGIIAIVLALAFAMIDNDLVFSAGEGNFSLVPLVKPLAIVLVSSTTMLFLAIFLASRLYPSKAFSRIALKTSLSSGRDSEGKEGYVGVDKENLDYLVGKAAVVANDLKPQGYVEIEGKIFQASIETGYAQRGEKVKIFRHEGGRLYCKKDNI